MAEQTPTVGRIVHYVDANTSVHLAAIITSVNQDGTLELTVFTVGGNPYPVRNVIIAKWHFPERV
jgi:CRISPR/Cas system endoribonuclease Cas6 (RAMP superfamily)